jgi:hypothetical protein
MSLFPNKKISLGLTAFFILTTITSCKIFSNTTHPDEYYIGKKMGEVLRFKKTPTRTIVRDNGEYILIYEDRCNKPDNVSHYWRYSIFYVSKDFIVYKVDKTDSENRLSPEKYITLYK